MSERGRRRRLAPDVLGAGFEQLELPLGADDEGDVVATLVRHGPRAARDSRGRGSAGAARHPEPTCSTCTGGATTSSTPSSPRFWTGAGARFFALDLRKYGRSLRAGQTPGYVTDLAAYDADIEAALTAMGQGRADAAGPARARSSCVGHSTGGLTLSLWAARNPGRAAALVLNSPWLEFQLSGIGREAIAPVIGFRARVDPMGPLPNVDLGFYTRSIAKELDGEWEYDHEWRPDRGFPVAPGVAHRDPRGHATIAKGIDVGAPVLTLLSARSTLLPRWDAAMLTSRHRARRRRHRATSLDLAPEVTVARIDGALHDVFLSREPARAAAYAAITHWLGGYAPRA